MKKNLCIVSLFFAFNVCVHSQTNLSAKAVLVSFSLKNSSLIPKKVTLISYRPDEMGNGTNGFMVGSFGTKSFSFPEGTKLYLANNKQVNTVMSGAKISDQKPFLIVKTNMKANHSTFNK